MIKTARLLLLFIIMCASCLQAFGQITPKEGRVLNYRIIGFKFPAAKGQAKEGNYKLEIAKGNYNDIDSFKKNIIVSKDGKQRRMIAEVPLFGCQYTWRVVEDKGNGQKSLHHFSTDTASFADTNFFRLRIIADAKKYKDAYVFLDNTKGLYDMQGHLVWFLPKTDKTPRGGWGKVRDLRVSPQHTLTFLTGKEEGFESTYDGEILWRTPAIDSSRAKRSSYNHEFTRLSNGNYMAVSTERIMWKGSDTPGDNILHKPREIKMAKGKLNKMSLSGIVEFNSKGDTVWTWNGTQYYLALLEAQKEKGVTPKNIRDPLHTNSFYFDEKKKELYISFRNLSQVIKVKYPTGEVMDVYGASGSFDLGDQQSSPFSLQHACKISKEGYLYLFNNNSYKEHGKPEAVIMQMPRNAQEHLKKIWEYECLADTTNIGKRDTSISRTDKALGTAGGNVIELDDRDMFISSCLPYSDMHIVSKGKDVLWSAMAELWSKKEEKWVQDPQYRATIIPNRKELERFIWGE